MSLCSPAGGVGPPGVGISSASASKAGNTVTVTFTKTDNSTTAATFDVADGVSTTGVDLYFNRGATAPAVPTYNNDNNNGLNLGTWSGTIPAGTDTVWMVVVMSQSDGSPIIGPAQDISELQGGGGGGTTVAANPTGEVTQAATRIQIGSQKYNLQDARITQELLQEIAKIEDKTDFISLITDSRYQVLENASLKAFPISETESNVKTEREVRDERGWGESIPAHNYYVLFMRIPRDNNNDDIPLSEIKAVIRNLSGDILPVFGSRWARVTEDPNYRYYIYGTSLTDYLQYPNLTGDTLTTEVDYLHSSEHAVWDGELSTQTIKNLATTYATQGQAGALSNRISSLSGRVLSDTATGIRLISLK